MSKKQTLAFMRRLRWPDLSNREFIVGMILMFVWIPAIIIAAVACAPPPKKGIVISTEYNRAHYNTYMYCGHYATTQTRTASGSISTSTTCDLWLPAQYWVKDAWSLKLKDGKHKGWREVPQSVYDGPCGHLDAFYPDCIT